MRACRTLYSWPCRLAAHSTKPSLPFPSSFTSSSSSSPFSSSSSPFSSSSTASNASLTIDHNSLRQLASSLLHKSGLSLDHAQIVADALVNTTSHTNLYIYIYTYIYICIYAIVNSCIMTINITFTFVITSSF